MSASEKRKRLELTALDRMIGYFSPARAYRRAQYRHAMSLYEAGSRSSRLGSWKTPGSSVNQATQAGLAWLRARARSLGANNAHASAAHRELAANIVGTGIVPHVRLDDKERRRPAELLIDDYFDTSDCDLLGRSNLYGLQQLAVKTMIESGEVLIRRVRRALTTPSGRVQIPFQLQVLEPDYLDTEKNGPYEENHVIQGVEYSPRGRVVAYWLYDHHPGDASLFMRSSWRSRRHAASDIIHMYRTDRPGQVRGVPWGAPVIIRLRDWDEYSDAQLYRQKIAACFTAFVIPGDRLGLGMGGEQQDDETDLPERLEPGLIERLDGGRDVKFASPPAVEGFQNYSTVTLHEIAAGYGIPYSVMTGDLRQVNFSSGRMGDRAFNRNVQQWQQQIVIPQMCDRIWRWFMAAAVDVRLLDGPLPARWSPPRRELTDPAREIPAIRDSVRSGLMTLPEAIRQQGYDPDDLLEEARAWNELMDDYGLVYDTDPRKVSAAGLTQARAGEAALPPTAPDETEED